MAGRLLSPTPSHLRPRPGPGGVDDGLPALPDGEPVLHRWFAIAMVLLVPAGLAVAVWALASVGRPTIDPAARRPPGTATVTHDRGDAALNEIRTAEPGPGCAEGITMIGDDGARAALRRALAATCQVLEDDTQIPAREGLAHWLDADGVLRVGVFERTGVESSARVEDDRIVIELNAKFQFENAERAAPAIVHELVHLALGFPGEPVDAVSELTAVRAQATACERLVFAEDPPRGCRDAQEMLATEDPLAALTAAGYEGREP